MLSTMVLHLNGAQKRPGLTKNTIKRSQMHTNHKSAYTDFLLHVIAKTSAVFYGDSIFAHLNIYIVLGLLYWAIVVTRVRSKIVLDRV